MLKSPINAGHAARDGRWFGAMLLVFAAFFGAAVLMETYTRTRADSTIQQLPLRLQYYEDAVAYLKTFAGESEILNSSLIEGPTLYQISGAIGLARNSEALAFVLYRRHAPIPGAAGNIAENIDEVHRMFDVGTKEMLIGANGDGNEHIVSGTGLFQGSLKLATATLREINVSDSR